MTTYDAFAPYYDAIMGTRQQSFERVIGFIQKYKPETSTVLELGSGTGSVLKGLSPYYKVSGIELSPEMLAVAHQKVPQATLHQGDMTELNLSEKFDCIVCVYDTINHLLSFEKWEKVFQAVASHLNSGGLFIFDMNTIGRLNDLSHSPAGRTDFEEGYALIPVKEIGDQQVSWDIEIFDKNNRLVAQEHIKEASFSLDQVKAGLLKHFTLKEISSITDGEEASDQSKKVFFVSRI